MASLAISATRPQPQLPDLRNQANQESGGMMDTVRRITPLILGLIAGIGSSIILGPISGLLIGAGIALVTTLSTNAVSSIWDSCQHSHSDGNQAPSMPWYRQIVNWIPTDFGSSDQYPSRAHGHVGVGGGHFREHVDRGFGGPPPTGAQGHVGVGRGHVPNPGHGGPPPQGRGGHVGVGGGHVPPPGHGGMPAPHGAPGHVGVGGGHMQPPPGGHVGVGGGHFH